MKVKNLNFGLNSLECGLMQFVSGHDNIMKASKLKLFLVEKRSSRSFYVYAQQFGYDFPLANYRVSGNSDVSSVVNEVLSILNSSANL